MLGFVTRLVGDDGRSPDEADAADGREGRQRTRLYECPDCELVYLSADLAHCGSCGTGVEPVPSESDLGFGSGDVGGD